MAFTAGFFIIPLQVPFYILEATVMITNPSFIAGSIGRFIDFIRIVSQNVVAAAVVLSPEGILSRWINGFSDSFSSQATHYCTHNHPGRGSNRSGEGAYSCARGGTPCGCP